MTTNEKPSYTEEVWTAGTLREEKLIRPDGTGRLRTFTEDGTLTGELELAGLEYVEPPPPAPDLNDPPPADVLELLNRAEEARNAAYNAVMAGGIRTMARLEDADRAGAAAAQAVLNSRGTP